MEFSFFTTDNRSGYKTNEKWLSKNHNKLYNDIINYSTSINVDLNFKEKIYFYFHNLTKRPKCAGCDKTVEFKNRYDKPYSEFCSLECFNSNKDEMVKRQKKTFNEKYGIDFYPQHVDFMKKQKETKLLKYGDENYNNSKKNKQTSLERYGNKNFNNHEKNKITCIERYGVDNYTKSNTYQKKIFNNFKEKYPNLDIKSIHKNIINIKCDECKTDYEITKQLIYERNKLGYTVCVNCNPIGQSNRSGLEDELSNFLTDLNIDHIKSYRKLKNNKEIDVLIPEKNLGIEINGTYWHNELFVESHYHLNKTIECNNLGIDLIHIFEDEWLYKKEIVKSIIKNKLNLTENKIYGRNCEIKEIDSIVCKDFLENNHIQGNVNSKVRLGLFNKNTLVSVMTFSKGRICLGGKKNEWELNRYSNILNTNVIGASSKLLKYFIKHYKPELLISYSDIRLFSGKMYEKIGFKMKSQSKPNYWYVINGIRYHRFGFRKSQLIKEGYNKKHTESMIMLNRKIYRIYDCGNIRWELKI